MEKCALLLCLLPVLAAAQGGCCCSMEWSSQAASLGRDLHPDGSNLTMYYSLGKGRARIDFFDKEGKLSRQYWSRAEQQEMGTTWVYDIATGQCTSKHFKFAWVQLCWDASDPLWHLNATHGDCPQCTILWEFTPQGSYWVTGHPCNALRTYGSFQGLSWLGADFGPIRSSDLANSTWDLPKACL